jgi:ADP-ribosylglycohydrolase
LDGLSIGDGFGECFFSDDVNVVKRERERRPPPAPWIVTDDTVMALSVVRCLKREGHINQDTLAAAFASEYSLDPGRGYGGGAHKILWAISQGTHWKEAAGRAFKGQGSCGNGGAMRSAPIGAYFADDLDRVIEEARASAEVTHFHPDGQTGAIAVALATAWMTRERRTGRSHALIEFVLEHLPRTETHDRLTKALAVPLDKPPLDAVYELGNGSHVIASDTVPFCLWCAARHADDYTEALWTTASGCGDIDTNCAIVGGIVSMNAGRENIPLAWLNAREPIQI